MEIRGKPVLKKVIRLDSTPLNRAFFTEEGYLIDTPIVTSTGIFEYGNPDGSIRRELRLPEEVFDPDSLASYQAKPVIITHDAGLVTKDNVSDEEIGTILTKGYRDGDNVRAKIVIHDTDEMKQSGLKELSLGYNLELDETPGTWNGEHYDAIQRKIRINHLALVREARAGEQARLNVDSKDAKKGAKAMSRKRRKTRRADGILSPDELKAAIEEYRKAHPLPEKADEEEETNEVPVPPKAAEDDCGDITAKRQGDEEGAENELKEANETIARQDEDIQKLLDIIDTLLAEKEFDEAEEVKEEVEVQKEDEEEEPLEEKLAEDEDEEEEKLAEDEEEILEEELTEDEEEELKEELAEDEDEEEVDFEEDEDDDVIPNRTPEDLAPSEVMNADAVDRIVRDRVKIGIAGDQLNMDGLNSMSIRKAKKRIIKAVRPSIRLDGKSTAYINAMFDLACEELKKVSHKGTDYQKKQMFNKDSRRARRRMDSAEAHRDRMIARRNKRNKKEGK